MPGNFIIFHVAMVLLVSSTDGQDSKYLGCFYDNPNRALSSLTSCSEFMSFCNNYCSINVPYCQSSTNMSVTNCLSLCASKNFVYAGVQASSQCFCGGPSAVYDRYGEERNDTLCKSSCTGDFTQDCGKDYRMRVYKIGCLPFDAPQNSTLSPTNESFFEIGQTLDISCQEGFFLSSPGNLTCLPIGEWNLQPPSCLPDVCTPPELPLGSTARRNDSHKRAEFSGGDTLVFDCNDTDVIVNMSCVNAEWHIDGVCLEIQATEILASIITEISTTAEGDLPTDVETTEKTITVFSEAIPHITTRELDTTTHAKDFTTPHQAIVTYVNVTVISSDDITTLRSSTRFNHTLPVNMLWLIIIVGAALFLFVIVLFFAVMITCRKKAKRDTPITFQNDSQIPRMEDMTQVNHAYETDTTNQPNQNGRQTLGSPIRISSLYSQQEITIENNNDSHYDYAKPVSPAYTTSQSGTVPNEYASPVHRHTNSEGRTGSSVYSPDIPEPDYDLETRESYVETFEESGCDVDNSEEGGRETK